MQQFTASLDFQVLTRLGASEAQCSSIFQVQNASLGGACVAKLINLRVLAAAEEEADPWEEVRMLRECAHSSICQILGAGLVRADDLHREEVSLRPDLAAETDGPTHLAIFMPHYAGGSLTGRLPLSARPTVKILTEVLAALSVVHQRNILHLDLKPSNVLFHQNDDLVLADFGQSARLKAEGLAQARLSAYRMCMPPEYYLDPEGRLTVGSDVYVAGAFAYRLLNGENLWEAAVSRAVLLYGLVRAICEGNFPDRSHYLPHIHPDVRTIINRALDPDPSLRWPSAAAFGEALARVEDQLDWSGQQTHEERFQVGSFEISKEDRLWQACGQTFPTRAAAFEAVTARIYPKV